MNKIAGTIVYKWFLDGDTLEKFEYACFDTALETENTAVLVFWETKLNAKEIKEELSWLWEVVCYDVSHSENDRIMLLNKKVEGQVHEEVSFEGIETVYEEIIERFAESYEAVAIREAEVSEKYGTKIIRVEFIY